MLDLLLVATVKSGDMFTVGMTIGSLIASAYLVLVPKNKKGL